MFTAKPSTSPSPHLLFIDGDCLLCQGSARFLLGYDEAEVLSFAPLQGTTAETYLPDDWREVRKGDGTATGAVALVENPGGSEERSYRGFDALCRCCYLVGGALVLLYPLCYLPRFIKSPLYWFISRIRHGLAPLFSKNSCPLPTAETSARFLP